MRLVGFMKRMKLLTRKLSAKPDQCFSRKIPFTKSKIFLTRSYVCASLTPEGTDKH